MHAGLSIRASRGSKQANYSIIVDQVIEIKCLQWEQDSEIIESSRKIS